MSSARQLRSGDRVSDASCCRPRRDGSPGKRNLLRHWCKRGAPGWRTIPPHGPLPWTRAMIGHATSSLRSGRPPGYGHLAGAAWVWRWSVMTNWHDSPTGLPGPRFRTRPFELCSWAGAAYRNRTDDLRITRGTIPSRTHASCTDTTDHRTDGTLRAGIIRRPGPRTGPRPRPCVPASCYCT